MEDGEMMMDGRVTSLLEWMLHHGRHTPVTDENTRECRILVERGWCDTWRTSLDRPAIVMTGEGERVARRLERGSVR